MPSQAIWSTYCPRKLRRGSRLARCRKKPPSSRTRCRCSRRTGRTVGQTWEALCPRTRAVPSSSLPARERSAPVRSWSRPSRRTDASRPWGRKREGHENVFSVRVAVCVCGGVRGQSFRPIDGTGGGCKRRSPRILARHARPRVYSSLHRRYRLLI